MKKSPLKLNALAFIIGLGAVTQVNVGITHLSFSEVFLTIMASILLVQQKHSLQGSYLKLLLFFLFLWISAAVISDFFVNNTYIISALKGIFRLVVLGGCIYSLHYLFMQNPLLWRYYTIGACISLALGFLVLGMSSTVVDELAGEERGTGWEQTYNYIFSAFIAVLNAWLYGRFPRVVCIILFIAGVVNIAMGSRSTGGIFIMSSITLLYLAKLSSKSGGMKVFKLTLSKTIPAIVLAIFAIFALYSSYTYTASIGLLGEEARVKYEKQSQSPLGLISGARPEAICGFLAAMDAPIIGHGSFAIDYNGYFIRTIELVGDLRYLKRLIKRSELNYIQSHSKIFEAWVAHGVIGAFFWLYLLYFYIMFVNRGLFFCQPLVGVLVVLIFNAFWSYCFSPIVFRVVEASSIALIFAIADHQKNYIMMSLPQQKGVNLNNRRVFENNKGRIQTSKE